jgi:hypothetical protein
MDPVATITPQACSPIRLDHSRSKPTIAATCLEDFSCSAFALRTIGVSLSNAAGAASFAARMAGAGGQPGRERPHLRTPDPDPRVGSGVAHVPAAGDQNASENRDRNAWRIRYRFVEQNAIKNPVGICVDIIRHSR